jgi:hypothetical protein
MVTGWAAAITAFVIVDFATAALKMPIPDGFRGLHRWYDKWPDVPAPARRRRPADL